MPDNPQHTPERDALIQIARGRPRCGVPVSGETARQIARAALVAAGIDWSETQTTETRA